ncbi:MAG: helix-turn-helix transcriptional regulator [Emergencia sp.]|nr:helix-turn-helix transcriptional regulator [Emergencia sp.]
MTLKEFDRVGMGVRIRLSRERANFSREQLSEHLDITPKFLSDMNAATEDSLCRHSYYLFKSWTFLQII